jgi:uncharacterized protein YukE
MAPLVAAPAVDVCTGGGAATIAGRICGSPESITATAMQRLQQAEHFIRIIEQLTSASQSLERAWSGAAAESAVQKIMSSIGSFIRIVEAIQQGAALLHLSAGLITSAQTAYNNVMSWVNPIVGHAISNPITYGFGEALATGSVASLNTYVLGVQAALQAVGAGKMMEQVAVLATVMMDIERLAQGGGNAAADASAMIGLYRAGKMGVSTLNSSSMSGAISTPQTSPPPTPAPPTDPGTEDSLDA